MQQVWSRFKFNFMKLKFPKHFYWGTATSAYQVEGGINNNWSMHGSKYDAGLACDHYNRYEEDFDLAKQMNNNAHRFSIEWARIEPEQGKFDQQEIEHYRKILKALRARKIEPFVTIWHWTLPTWLARKGGLVNKDFSKYFERYVKKIAGEYKHLVKFWIVLNEPMVPLGYGYFRGEFPPFKKLAFLKFRRAFFNLINAYKKSYAVIHKINSQAQVSISQMTNYFEPARKWCPIELLISKLACFFTNDYFYSHIKQYIDFVGISYYHHYRIVWYPPFKKNLNKQVNDIGWEIYPQGIYITENGLADAKDNQRKEFISQHLKWVQRAIKEGIDVRGYFHWSLIDNYEWARGKTGFEPRFGLIEIDYNRNLQRKPRPSSRLYARICENNALKL